MVKKNFVRAGLARLVYGALSFAERRCAHALGKGYGSATMKQEVKVLAALLREPPRLAIDIGGNVGEYTAELRKLDRDLDIVVFEPSQTNTARLGQRFGQDPRVTIVPCALSDQEGAATLFSDAPGSGLGSLTKRRLEERDITFDTAEAVAVLRFEKYWREQLACRPLDLVKIDVEGHEIAVLNGFGEAMHAVRVLQFEFGGCNVDTRTFFRDFWYFFKERGFDLHRITPWGTLEIARYKSREEYFSTTNYVALHRDRA